jgi:hypothetical protein
MYPYRLADLTEEHRMPPGPKKKIVTTGIVRVLLKGDGWIEIVPGSFNFTSLDFYLAMPEDQDDQFSGLTYLGFTFKDNKTGNVYAVPTDGIGAIEIAEGGN